MHIYFKFFINYWKCWLGKASPGRQVLLGNLNCPKYHLISWANSLPTCSDSSPFPGTAACLAWQLFSGNRAGLALWESPFSSLLVSFCCFNLIFCLFQRELYLAVNSPNAYKARAGPGRRVADNRSPIIWAITSCLLGQHFQDVGTGNKTVIPT